MSGHDMAVVIAANYWWESIRPLGWDVVEHKANPTVNTNTEAEKVLAQAVARAARGRA